jgi:predicted restriction endonuclease
MNKLEEYLDQFNYKELQNNIYTKYSEFLYDDEELYLHHLNFLLENIYSIKIIESKRKRLNQTEFRNEILNKFNYKCIISNISCIDELTAAHIIPIKDNENYDIDNGLLLTENLHKTYDKYRWSINPDTLLVEINKNINVGSIKYYENQKILLQMNTELYSNLLIHYNTFIEKNKIT